MKKINMGKGIVNYPMPVALAGTVVSGRVNFMTVAWLSMANYNPPKIAITLGNHHFSNRGIKENKAFSLCFPSQEHIELVDLCGLISGEKEDKSGLFEVFYGESGVAPMIGAFHLNVECTLDKIVANGSNETFIGEIQAIHADESILIDGQVDMARLNPIILSQTSTEYRAIGAVTGRAWQIGRRRNS